MRDMEDLCAFFYGGGCDAVTLRFGGEGEGFRDDCAIATCPGDEAVVL